MADFSLQFEIYIDNQFVGREVLSEGVIKVGKLASSHLRLDHETVSRMHAVIEVNGPSDIQLVDLGSTRGTMLNGERVTKVSLQSGDEVQFGDVKVVVVVGEIEQTVVAPALDDQTRVTSPDAALLAGAQEEGQALPADMPVDSEVPAAPVFPEASSASAPGFAPGASSPFSPQRRFRRQMGFPLRLSRRLLVRLARCRRQLRFPHQPPAFPPLFLGRPWRKWPQQRHRCRVPSQGCPIRT